jgi:hypothetical protein
MCMYIYACMHVLTQRERMNVCIAAVCMAQALPAEAQRNQTDELSAALAEKHERLLVSTPVSTP